MMLSSIISLAAAACAVAAQSYTTASVSYPPHGGSYPDSGGPYTTAGTNNVMSGKNYTPSAGSYPPTSGSGPQPDYPPTSGSGPQPDYPPTSGSGPQPDYPPTSGSGPQPDYPPTSGSGPQPDYPPTSGSGPQPDYPPTSGSGPQPDYPPTSGSGQQTDYPPTSGSGPQTDYPSKSGSGPQTDYPSKGGSGPQTDYPSKSGSGPQTDYSPKSGSGPQTDYPSKSGSGPQSNYPPQSGSGPQTDYSSKSGSGPQTDYSPKSGSGPQTDYPSKSGSGPQTNYPPQSGSGPQTDYPPQSGSYTPAKGSYPPSRPANYPSPAVNPYGSGSDNNLRHDIAEVKRNIVDQNSVASALNITLAEIRGKVSTSNKFREEFQKQLFPAIQTNLKKTTDRIANLKAQLKDLTGLSDLVVKLSTATTRLVADLKKIRENRASIMDSLTKLQIVETDQEPEIAALCDHVKYHDTTVKDIVALRSKNDASVQRITKNLIKAVNIINKEKAESVVIYLYKGNSTANFTYTTPFAEKPSVVYSIIAATYEAVPDKYSSGYGQGGKDETDVISSRVVVTTDTHGCSVRLTDKSDGWVTTFLSVRITAFLKDNSIIYYEEYKNSTANPGYIIANS